MTARTAIGIIKKVDICCNAAETARDLAIQALQEKLERENGCACCNNHVPVKDFAKEYSIEVDDVEVSLWEDLKCLATIKINYCPMCGRRLEHIGEATNMVEGE